MAIGNWFRDFAQDLRFAARLLQAKPMFTAVVVVTLGLGIGANTAIFSVMNAVVLRSLPVADPQRLVFVRGAGFPDGVSQTGNGDQSLPMRAFEELRKERAIFEDLMAFVPLSIGYTPVRVGNEPEEAYADMVSGTFFSGIGVRAHCGRTFTLEDETKHALVAVLSYNYWTRRFGEDCSAVGKTIFVRGVAFTIVGVAAKGFIGIEAGGPTDVWIPLQDRTDLNAWGMQEGTPYTSPHWWFLMVMGRLAPGVSEKAAEARLTPVYQRAVFATLARQPAKDEKLPNVYFESTRGLPGLRDAYDEPLRILLAMVGLVLVIACGNVAMMLASRNAARQREFSIRMAIGGGRTRLFRQLLTESLLLVAGGAALAWFFGDIATGGLAAWSELDFDLAPDRTVLGFTLAVSLVVALLFGLAPLRSVIRVPLGLTLKTSSATAHTDRQRTLGRKTGIALQIALCLMLVTASGLLVKTLSNLQRVNLGLRTQGLLVFGITPHLEAQSDENTIRFYESLLNRLRNLPRVESVTLVQNRIGSGWSNNTSVYVDGKSPKGDEPASLRWNSVGPDYFRTLGTPIRFGRDLTEADSADAPKVAIINETFARRYLNGQNPIGHTLALSKSPKAAQLQIVGVAADSKYTGVSESDTPMAYISYKQLSGISTMHVELRTSGEAAALLPAVQRAVREFAPELPLLQPRTQQAQFESTFSNERLFARMAMFFGLLAVVLVATGIYGALSNAVSRRTSEIGIRMSLGAQRTEVLWMVLRETIVMCGAGVALGLPAAIAATRLLRSMLYGVEPGDPLTFVAALAGIVIVALGASILPAHRAASTDPLVALRYE